MKIESVKSEILFEAEAENIKQLVEKAVRTGADLTGADLSDAKLWRAKLAFANLDFADLTGANLWRADLRGARLWRTNLTGANLTGAKIDYQIQEGLLARIAGIVLRNPEKLEMDDYHGECGTTHCLAGWACHLNPVAKALETTHGTQIAGLLTLGAEAHSFFSKENEEVIEWLKTKRAA